MLGEYFPLFIDLSGKRILVVGAGKIAIRRVRTLCSFTQDILVIAPCTGNTMAKLAAGITDTPVLMAAKAHMRNDKPVVLSPATNDALGASLKNIGFLMNTKNFYFVPFGQDDCEKKPKSMIAHTELIPDTIEAALCGRQLQPVIRSPF